MRRFSSFRDFDWMLLSLVILMSILSVLEIKSATLHTKFRGFDHKQIGFLLVGMVLMFLMSLIDYHRLLDIAPWAYGIGLLSLVAVRLVGTKVLGARRWINLGGGIHFQPSEWVKLVLIVAMARFFWGLAGRELSWTDIAKAFALIGVPMLLVLKQPDLGTALTYFPVLVAGLFLGGIRVRQALILLLGSASDRRRVDQRKASEAVPDGAADQLHRSRQRSARRRLPDPAVEDRGRRGRTVGQGNQPGNADPGRLPAHSVHRLHLCRLLRGARLRGRHGRPAAVLPDPDALDRERATGLRHAGTFIIMGVVAVCSSRLS